MILTFLVGCAGLDKSQKAINLLQKSTIYYLGDEVNAIYTLSSRGIYIDPEDRAQNEFMRYNTSISIKDSGHLQITVDNALCILEIASTDSERIQKIYETIIDYLENTDRVKELYPSLVFDTDNKVSNISLDVDRIIFDFSEYGIIDTRLLEIYLCEYNPYIETTEINNLILTGINRYTTLFTFKHDAVYGISNTTRGKELLGRVNNGYLDRVIKMGDNIYKGISFNTVIETVGNVIESNRLRRLNIESLIENNGINESINIYFEESVKEYKYDIIKIFESVGFDVVEVGSRMSSDVIIGYTLFANGNNQLMSDRKLMNRIMNHSNCSGTIDDTVYLLFRTAWGIQ